jgi:serine/threonine protein kinase
MEMASFGDGWEGRVIEGLFPLLERLGGTENCGLYFTVLQGMHEAVIQLISTDAAQADTDIAQWNFAMSLSHPHLAKVFAAGRCVIDQMSLVYVVGERSSTNLAKTIESGTLEAGRAKEIFNPIVDALKYLHSNGVVHGHLNPSNIHFDGSKPRLLLTDLLVAGPVKRSIGAAGNYDAPELRNGEVTEAADTWSLGMTMWEAMTQTPPPRDLWRDEEPEVPVSLPSPFREIAQDCLRLDPVRRCTLQTVQERLDAREAMPLSKGSIPEPVIGGPQVDDTLLATDPIGASEGKNIDQPVAHFSATHFSAPEEIESKASSEEAVFSRSLTHFEEAHLPRSRVMPYAVVLLAVAAIGAFLFVREHKAGALPVALEKVIATSATAPQKQEPAPAPPTPTQTEQAQTEPATSPAGSQDPGKDVPQAQPASGQATQADGTPQGESRSASAVNPPVARAPASVDRERTEGNAKGLVAQRILPTVSPGARGGMRRPVEVLIRVSVNQEGTVSDAAYVVPGPGNYFARVAQRAALSWKFKPPVQNGDPERSVWMLKFNFGRGSTEATATEEEQ